MVISPVINLENLATLCQRSSVGKRLPNALYVHTQAIAALNPQLQFLEQRARDATPEAQGATLVKFHTEKRGTGNRS